MAYQTWNTVLETPNKLKYAILQSSSRLSASTSPLTMKLIQVTDGNFLYILFFRYLSLSFFRVGDPNTKTWKTGNLPQGQWEKEDAAVSPSATGDVR